MNHRSAGRCASIAVILSFASAVAGCGSSGAPTGGTAIIASDSSGGPVSAWGQSQTLIDASPGQEVDIILGNVGPGNFDSPPTISSGMLQFLGDSLVGPYVPAGERQQFRFVSSDTGVAIVAFHHSDNGGPPGASVTDTIHVR